MRLKGKGLVKGGDQLVVLKLTNPKASTAGERTAFEALKASFPNFNPRTRG